MNQTELAALLEGAGDAAYAVTADGVIRCWNGAAVRMLGYQAADVIGRNIDDVLHARDGLGAPALDMGLDAAARRIDTALEPLRDFDIEVGASDGRRIWINVSTIAVKRERRQSPLIVRLARDITVRKERERLLERFIPLARQLVAISDVLPAPAPVAPLSQQERRILRLLLRGASSADVERELAITPQTLRNHLYRINGKLRTRTRLEAVAHARLRGLID